MSEETAPIVIIGAGMAGLSCALKLQEAGKDIRVLEAGDRVGGRIRTDEKEGYLIDRGFQVYLDAYPTAGALLDLDALDLRKFEPGALIWRGGKLHRMMDVFRRKAALFSTAFSAIGSLGDKLKVGLLRLSLKNKSLEKIQSDPDMTTEALLKQRGFSPEMIDGFFRGFYGGIFLERDLRTSSRMFEFTFKMFANGSATVPAKGMQQIPEQLAARLRAGTLRLGSPVEKIEKGKVTLQNGEVVEASQIVVATDAKSAANLVPEMANEMPAWRSEVNFAFGFEGAVLVEPIIALNGMRRGVINNVCNMAAVSPDYAPAGHSLLMVTVLGASENPALESQVRAELSQWFETDATTWKLISRDRIVQALPEQGPNGFRKGYLKAAEGIWMAGDYCESASIEGAVVSGQKVANFLLEA